MNMQAPGGRSLGWMRQVKARWASDRRVRLLLTLQLAVVLPAAALIYLNFYHLKSVERDKVLEAAIHRDFQLMLAIAENQINHKIKSMAEDARRAFPEAGTPEPGKSERLDALLTNQPGIGHVFIFDRGAGLVVRSNPVRLTEPEFREERVRFSKTLHTWLVSESKDFLGEMRKKGREITLFTERTPGTDGRYPFLTTAFFAVPSTSGGAEALGGVRFDAAYLTQTFFPKVLDELIAYRMGEEGTTPLAMSVTLPNLPSSHAPSTSAAARNERVLAASSGWSIGAPEVSRNLEEVFRGLSLGIKFQGISAAALGRNWAFRGFVTLGVLSLFLVGGLVLAYRGISKELALARLQSDFVSNVSHELRTPLSLIRLHAETLELGRVKTPERIQEYYSTIRTESERLTGLIDNILDFSRLEAGRKEYDFRLQNIGDLVRETVEIYRAQIDDHGFELSVSIDRDLPVVRVDRDSIARSLVNLMNNALKYSDRRKFLGIRLYRSGSLVQLEVTDRGIGIARGEQVRIFEKFYRVGNALVHNTKGSGLGLSLVRRIAEAHDGDIRVESALGRGSTFTLSLPAAVEDVSHHTVQHEG
jgi:signal transduction histidine kinase